MDCGTIFECKSLKAKWCSNTCKNKQYRIKFQIGMTWNNYSVNGWHIDHIKPLNLFDLTDPNQLKEACHYTNLQPMWAKHNRSKSDFYEER